MRIFTLEGTNGQIQDGATVVYQDLAGKTFSFIKVGEAGRNRQVGRLEVILADEIEINRVFHGTVVNKPWPMNPSILVRQLKAEEDSTENETIILVAKAGIGFRGGNSYQTLEGKTHPKFDFYNANKGKYVPLAYGAIAQGDAGAMGSGAQFITELSIDDPVLKIHYSGRMYGKPTSHYIWWDGEKLHCLTDEEYTHYSQHSV